MVIAKPSMWPALVAYFATHVDYVAHLIFSSPRTAGTGATLKSTVGNNHPFQVHRCYVLINCAFGSMYGTK